MSMRKVLTVASKSPDRPLSRTKEPPGMTLEPQQSVSPFGPQIFGSSAQLSPIALVPAEPPLTPPAPTDAPPAPPELEAEPPLLPPARSSPPSVHAASAR